MMHNFWANKCDLHEFVGEKTMLQDKESVFDLQAYRLKRKQIEYDIADYKQWCRWQTPEDRQKQHEDHMKWRAEVQAERDNPKPRVPYHKRLGISRKEMKEFVYRNISAEERKQSAKWDESDWDLNAYFILKQRQAEAEKGQKT